MSVIQSVVTMIVQARRGKLSEYEAMELSKLGFTFTKNNDPRCKNEFDVGMEV